MGKGNGNTPVSYTHLDVYKRQHILPMLHIPAGKFGLRVPAVVVFKSPVPHGGVGKAPVFQFLHGVKVPAPLLGGFPFLAGGSLAVALCRVAVTAKIAALSGAK